MPNHLEDIKCQEAEKRKKKSFAIFNGVFFYCTYFL